MGASMQQGESSAATAALPARERLIAAAVELFYAEGIHRVGVDRIIERAGVTRATMYNHFAGKEGLVLAYLAHEDAQLRGMFDVAAASTDEPERLLDLVVEGIAADVTLRHTRGCPFINAAAEYPDDGPVRELISAHREWFRLSLVALAGAAGAADADATGAALVLLRDAALVGAYLDGADRAVPAFADTARATIATRSRRPE